MNKSDHSKVVLYTPKSDVTNFRKLIRSMCGNVKASRELSWRIFVRDISAKYRQSLLGILWSFIIPIFTSLTFIYLHSKDIIQMGETNIPYPVYVFIGTILWQVFSESIYAPLKAVSNARSMLTRINFPHEALIIAAVYEIFFNLLIKIIILAGVFLYFQIPITIGLILAPIGVLMLILLGISLGLFITPFGLLYSDISSGLGLFMTFWFFITPVVYPPPQSLPLSLLAIFNPVSPLIIGTRDLIAKGLLTNIISFVVISILVLVVLFLSWLVYKVSLPIIIERMGS